MSHSNKIWKERMNQNDERLEKKKADDVEIGCNRRWWCVRACFSCSYVESRY